MYNKLAGYYKTYLLNVKIIIWLNNVVKLKPKYFWLKYLFWRRGGLVSGQYFKEIIFTPNLLSSLQGFGERHHKLSAFVRGSTFLKLSILLLLEKKLNQFSQQKNVIFSLKLLNYLPTFYRGKWWFWTMEIMDSFPTNSSTKSATEFVLRSSLK